jgi:energy-coupling factor transporter ATP-binding protein EcfA2
MALWRGQSLGIVFQFFQLLPTLTVLENVMLPMDFAKLYTPKERRERAMHLLELVDIAEHAHKLPTAISGGQQQRAAIARALANDPPILVADEPTGNLDSRTAGQVFDLFAKLVDEGKTILMVTHDDDQAKRVSRTVIIADGEIVNEYLARALPSLSQDQLLKATKQLEVLTFGPGEPIIWEGGDADKFFIIQKGQVNVYLTHPDDHETFVDSLDPGEYFGEMALLHGTRRTATVRAARHNEVEVVALDRSEFHQLISESDLTLAALETEANRRSETQARVRDESR